MNEIRLCWSIEGRENLVGEPSKNGLWHPDNEENLRTLEIVMECGNEQYGEGTHWIEQREA